MNLLALWCKARGRHVYGIIAVDGKSRWCKVCGTKQKLSAAMLKVIRDFEFVNGQQWTLKDIEEIRQRQVEAELSRGVRRQANSGE